MRGKPHEPPDWKALKKLSAVQFGVFTLDQARDRGVTDDQLHRAIRAGELEHDVRRIYRDAAVPASWEQKLMSAQLWAGPQAAVSHRSAAALLQLWGCEPGHVELTTPAARRPPRGVRLYRGLLSGADTATLGMFRISAATRTLIDLAGVVSDEALEIALDSALRNRLTSVPYLTARLNSVGSQGRKGCGTLSRLLAHRVSLGGLESPLETKFLRLVRRAGLPMPEAGFEVGRYRIDFAYPQAKLGIELEGLDYHSGRQALNRDKARRNYFTDLGWVILYFTWDDVTRRPVDALETLRNHLFPRLVR